MLALTGSLFSISGLVAYNYNNPITAYTSFITCLTSLLFHSNRTHLIYWLDQIALYTVVVRSFIDGYQGGLLGFAISASICSYNYFIFFGPYSNQLCFHQNQTIGKRWHATIHIASVLGIILQQQCIV